MSFHNTIRSYSFYSKIEAATIRSANKISQYKIFHRLGSKLGTNPNNLTYGTIETVAIYNALLLPVWAPLNFVCSLFLIRCYRSHFKGNEEIGDATDISKGNDNENDDGNGGRVNGANGNGNCSGNDSEHRNHRNVAKFSISNLDVVDIGREWLCPSTICFFNVFAWKWSVFRTELIRNEWL